MNYPKYPTVAELASLPVPEPSRRRSGFFEQYLNKDPAHILQDSRDRPEAYKPEALAVLASLYGRKTKWADLSDAHKKLLDEASLEFLSPSRVEAEAKKAKEPQVPMKHPQGGPSTPTPVTGPSVDPFWWTR